MVNGSWNTLKTSWDISIYLRYVGKLLIKGSILQNVHSHLLACLLGQRLKTARELFCVKAEKDMPLIITTLMIFTGFSHVTKAATQGHVWNFPINTLHFSEIGVHFISCAVCSLLTYRPKLVTLCLFFSPILYSPLSLPSSIHMVDYVWHISCRLVHSSLSSHAPSASRPVFLSLFPSSLPHPVLSPFLPFLFY